MLGSETLFESMNWTEELASLRLWKVTFKPALRALIPRPDGNELIGAPFSRILWLRRLL